MSLRIAMLGTRYSPPHIRGGEEMVMHHLKREFERRGHVVSVFTPAFGKWRDLDAQSDAKGVTRIPVTDVPFLYHFEFAHKLRRVLGGMRFDVVLNTHHCLGYGLGLHPHVVVVAVTGLGEARAMRVTGPGKLLEYLARRYVMPPLERRVYHEADDIVCVGSHIIDEVAGLYGVPRAKCREIGNGVDVETFCPSQPVGADELDPPVILYVGRLVSRKNVELLLDAAARLRDWGRTFQVHLAGEGDRRGALEARVAELRLGDRVQFLGRVPADRLPQVYRRSAVLVVPSRYESLGPLVLFEGQASGLPAVVAPYPSASRIVQHGRTGFVLSGDEPGELAGYLDQLLADPARRRQMGLQGRARMQERFSWAPSAEQFLTLFRDRFSLQV